MVGAPYINCSAPTHMSSTTLQGTAHSGRARARVSIPSIVPTCKLQKHALNVHAEGFRPGVQGPAASVTLAAHTADAQAAISLLQRCSLALVFLVPTIIIDNISVVLTKCRPRTWAGGCCTGAHPGPIAPPTAGGCWAAAGGGAMPATGGAKPGALAMGG